MKARLRSVRRRGLGPRTRLVDPPAGLSGRRATALFLFAYPRFRLNHGVDIDIDLKTGIATHGSLHQVAEASIDSCSLLSGYHFGAGA